MSARHSGRPPRAPPLSLRSGNHRKGLPERRARTWLGFEDLKRADKVFSDIKAVFRKGCLESRLERSSKLSGWANDRKVYRHAEDEGAVP